MSNQKGFDLVTHQKNTKGQLVRTNHYRLVTKDGVKMFERPQHSGHWFYENGEDVPKEFAPGPVSESDRAKQKKIVQTQSMSETATLREQNDALQARIAELESKQSGVELDQKAQQTLAQSKVTGQTNPTTK